MVPKGGDVGQVDLQKWPRQEMECLGHKIQSNAETDEAWRDAKRFTWKSTDLPTVRRLYRGAFEERFARAATLSYIDLGWGDAEALSLCRVIDSGALRHTRELNLTGNKITDDGPCPLPLP